MNQDYLKSKLTYNKKSGNLIWLSNGKIAGSVNSNGYIVITMDGKKYKAHKLVMLYINGYIPDMIDHIDRNKSNNRIENLRASTPSKNQFNVDIQKNNKSGFKGVFFRESKRKWVAQIKINKINKHLGYFLNLEDAIIARVNAEKEYL